MRTLLSTLFAALAVAVPTTPALAQEEAGDRPFYRVEAIVFTHRGSDSDAWPVNQPADHSQALDPARQRFARQQQKEQAANGRESVDPELAAALDMVETIASLENGETSLPDSLLYPEPWLALDELSEPMAQARTRLEQSGVYDVQAWLAWHQPLETASRGRTVRIHGDRLVAVDWITVSPTGRLLRNGRPVETIEDLAPALHYRLDGSIRLRKRQFMHADVTLDWRTPETIGPSPWPDLRDDAALETHRLEQSRTVRPGRFEYFDSQWLGLLLRVTAYQPEPAEPEPGTPVEETSTP